MVVEDKLKTAHNSRVVFMHDGTGNTLANSAR